MNNAQPYNKPHIAMLILDFGDGGVEHMMVNLCRGFAALGARVDLLVDQPERPFLNTLPESVKRIEITSSKHNKQLQAVVDYLEDHNPAVLMSAKISDDNLAMAAKLRTKHLSTRYFIRTGTNLSGRLRARGVNFWRRWLKLRELKRLNLQADGRIAVAQSVADDLCLITGLSPSDIQTIRNPTVTPELLQAQNSPSPHPWFSEPIPVILGIGGFRTQKDFATLIKAFAISVKQQPARLIILGEGRQRDRLKQLIQSLGISDLVTMPGFVKDAPAWITHARLFVLSSLWEGSPNVLVEAMALGTPVISTDCPGGSREILQDGSLGPLTPVGDPHALANAILQVLESPPDPDLLRNGVAEYDMVGSAQRYLEVFGLSDHMQL